MQTSDYGEVIVNSQDVFDALYNGQKVNLAECSFDNIDEVNQFNSAVGLNADNIPNIKLFQQSNFDQSNFDQTNQANWFMPKEYYDFEIVGYLLDKTTNEVEYQRVVTELELFAQHDMIDLLKYVKYLVDTMRKHTVVWGVGRGSSVASYVLYLMGVHKVDSIKYELDIHEFLK
jgi:DNA polymerase III alpha subunit